MFFQLKIQNTTCECFLALLEYLYTDHAPIEGGDAVGILVLADEYCQPRLLNLCELYITKEVDRSCTKNIEKADIDVIGLLLTAQVGMWSKHPMTNVINNINLCFEDVSYTLSRAH